jgi:hypothetical protein
VPRTLRLTFWPGFFISRNYLRNQSLKNGLEQGSIFFAGNFDARLAGIVIWPDNPVFGKCQGGLKSIEIDNIRKKHASKSRGMFFLRGPKRRRQLRHRRKGLVFVNVYISLSLYIYV